MISPMNILSAIAWENPDLSSILIFAIFFCIASCFIFIAWRNAREDRLDRSLYKREKCRAAHQCVHCGYSLPGNISGVCLECGKHASDSDAAAKARQFRPPIIRRMAGDRRIFTRGPIVSSSLCVISAVLYVALMQVTIYNPTPDFTFKTVPWLGWSCLAFAGITVGLAIKRVVEIRLAGDRVRRGLCPDCGYDLRATSGKCPECGRD